MRVRTFESKREADNFVDDKITEGYKIMSAGENSVKLKKVEYGSFAAHILIALLTAWWTFFLVNVAYAVYKYVTGEEVIVKYP